MLVFIGGGLGSVARYLLGIALQKSVHSHIPWHTLSANVIAAALLGFVSATLALKPGSYEQMRLFTGIGFCGGLSTFSTFTLEGFELIRSGHYLLALGYAMLSLAACLFSFWAAWAIQKG